MKKVLIGLFAILSLYACSDVNSLVRDGNLQEAEKMADRQNGDTQKKSYISLGNSYFIKEKYEEAGKLYKKAEYKEGLKLLGDRFLSEKDDKKALEFYQLSGIEKEKSIKNVAKYLISVKEYDKAAKYYSDINDNEGIINLAYIFYSEKEYEKALFYFQKAKENKGIMLVADEYYIQGKYEEAAKFYLIIDEKTKIKKIADAYFVKGEYKIAADYYQMLNDEEGLKKIGDFYSINKKYADAISYYIKSGLNQEEAKLQVAKLALDSGELQNSYVYYKELNDIEGLKNVGRAYFNKTDYANALDIFSEVNYSDGKIKVADIYFELGNYEAAIGIYRSEKDKVGLLKVADVYFQKKNYEESAYLYQEAENVEGKIGLKKIAETYFNEGKYEKARKYYELIKDYDGLKKIANYYYTKGKYEEAEKYYKISNDKKEMLRMAEYYLKIMEYNKAAMIYINSEEYSLIEANKKVADYLFEKKNYEEAIKFYEKAGLNTEINYVISVYLMQYLEENYLSIKNEKFARDEFKEKIEESLKKSKNPIDILNSIVEEAEIRKSGIAYRLSRAKLKINSGDSLVKQKYAFEYDNYKEMYDFYNEISVLLKKYLSEIYSKELEKEKYKINTFNGKVGDIITLYKGVEGFSSINDSEAKYTVKNRYEGRIEDIKIKNNKVYVKVGTKYYYKLEEGKYSY